MSTSLRDKMEEASPEELMPGFDKDAEWRRLSANLHGKKKKSPVVGLLAAAVLLLLGSTVAMRFLSDSKNAPSAHSSNWAAEVTASIPAVPSSANAATAAITVDTIIGTTNDQSILVTAAPAASESKRLASAGGYDLTKEFVCNATACPLEICIIQTIHCQDRKTSAIATCKILEPDQAKQLHYKTPEGVGTQCKVTVDEIRIRRINTGETIVLNAQSKPATAQDLFNCITGDDKCQLLAGIFETDCSNQHKEHSLKVDKDYGNLIME